MIAVKLSRTQILALLELILILLATVLLFRAGMVAARAQRGYDAYGGEYLILEFPVLYYIGKQILQDWLVLWRGDRF